MMSDKVYKGERLVMFLLKSSPCPVLDIVDFHIQLERKRAREKGTDAPTEMYLQWPVFQRMVDEVAYATQAHGVPAHVLRMDSRGFAMFHGVRISPFFSTPEAEAKLPHCSLLMIVHQGKFRGL